MPAARVRPSRNLQGRVGYSQEPWDRDRIDPMHPRDAGPGDKGINGHPDASSKGPESIE